MDSSSLLDKTTGSLENTIVDSNMIKWDYLPLFFFIFLVCIGTLSCLFKVESARRSEGKCPLRLMCRPHVKTVVSCCEVNACER